ncbi:MAG: PorT family protein [Bacteroidales bacterium]|nr:PorT family protein [Bacteroidales bacterium]
MVKKFFALFLLALLFTQSVMAQTEATPYTSSVPTDKETKPMVFRDRLIMDIYHTFWMGMPTQVNHMKFDPGLNVSALWDFKIKQKPLAFGVGIGVTYYTQYSNALLRYDDKTELMRYFILPENVDYKLLKMNYLSCNIPLEFRYRNNNGFKFTVGARVGLIAEISQKYKGDDPQNPSDTLCVKNLRIENKMKYNVDVYARIGWKFVDAYYCFQLTPLFEAGKGPKIYPMSVGLSFSLF